MNRRDADLAGTRVVWVEDEAHTPILYVHGVPNGGEMWRPFLDRTGGFAPDLPGFGESGKPADFDYSIKGYGDFLEEFVDHVGLDRYALVLHDWGGVGLELAQRRPGAVERLVLIDTVPFLPGYRWHRWARIWRTPLVGELFMGFSTKWGMKRLLRRAGALPDHALDGFLEEVWPHWDHGTQRAILKLYRGAPEALLARSGDRLGEIRAPALVVWGGKDIYLPTRFAHDYAEALGGDVRLELLPDATHWVWLDHPQAVDTITTFLRAD